MSEQKMGTNYVREICLTFRDIAEKSQFPLIKDKLTTLCDELEPLATKLYFKTQKGTEEMEEMAGEIEAMKDKLFACEQAEAAQGMCNPFFVKIGKIIEHVKTMRVRMT
ncbi:MAG: hypothetical protein ACLP7A_00920 [Desulfobaccales bacterium]